MRDVHLAQVDGEFEPVVRVGGHGQRLLLEPLRLEEARDRGVFRARDGGEDGVGRVEVFPDDGRLVVEHRQ